MQENEGRVQVVVNSGDIQFDTGKAQTSRWAIAATTFSERGTMLQRNRDGWLIPRKSVGLSLPVSHCQTNLVNPALNAAGGTIGTPEASTTGRMSNVATICAMANHKTASANACPGHILR